MAVHEERSGVLDQALDLEAFMHEIAQYLAVVDAFRREGSEPEWQADVLVVCEAGEEVGRWD